jgi:hypothetical protein
MPVVSSMSEKNPTDQLIDKLTSEMKAKFSEIENELEAKFNEFDKKIELIQQKIDQNS